jgi:putative phosphoesterase
MKIAIISDIHANLEALDAFPETYDELWVLGDLVNYGPNPIEAIDWVRRHASLIIRGNHDNAIGFKVDSQCSPRFRAMAGATGWVTERLLTEEQKNFLRELPESVSRAIDGKTFLLCHATPSNPLFEYRTAESPAWEHEEAAIGSDIVLAGHTHLPFMQRFGSRVIANPGSLGQSKAGNSRARYAVCDNGRIELKSYAYPVERTIAKLSELPISDDIKSDLTTVLRTGRVPPSNDEVMPTFAHR